MTRAETEGRLLTIEPPTFTVGLLGAKVSPLPGHGAIVNARLDEIERRILAIEARIGAAETLTKGPMP